MYPEQKLSVNDRIFPKIDRPIEEGYYCARFLGNDESEPLMIVHVVKWGNDGFLSVFIPGNEIDFRAKDFYSWRGPIKLPEGT